MIATRKMQASKTKMQILDVARQLFARNGFDYVTIGDIADASKKGRRTIYTYFKNKYELYAAVVESELLIVESAVEEVASSSLPPQYKILQFVRTHLETIKTVVYRNGTLRANFFRSIWRVECSRRQLDEKELILLRQIIGEGVANGVFDVDNIAITAEIFLCSLKGLEPPFIKGIITDREASLSGWKYMRKIVLGALGCKEL